MDDDEDEDDVGDDQSFASIDDLDGEVQFLSLLLRVSY
jgi:hypothetical protein